MAHGRKERAVSLISLKCSVISERNDDLAFCIFDLRGHLHNTEGFVLRRLCLGEGPSLPSHARLGSFGISDETVDSRWIALAHVEVSLESLRWFR